jgi:2-polyprenyl-3-methyl-5-hydroxy-6-metoxy-1,4-benzoquinol methylase
MSAMRDRLDFSHRWLGEELMDDPVCDETKLLRTIRQFTTINRLVSRYRSILYHTVLRDMAKDPKRTYHLIDVGAGGCDITCWLLQQAKRRSLSLRVTAIDGDPRTVAFARRQCGSVAGLTIEHADLMDLPRFTPADYIFSNHVLHHLPDAIIPSVLALMQASASRRWIVSDLYRSPWAYLGFQILGRFFRGSFAFEDGKRSIRRSLILSEVNHFAHLAGISDSVQVRRLMPGRLLITGDGHAAR